MNYRHALVNIRLLPPTCIKAPPLRRAAGRPPARRCGRAGRRICGRRAARAGRRAAPTSDATACGFSASSASSRLNQSPDILRAPRLSADAVPQFSLRCTRTRSAYPSVSRATSPSSRRRRQRPRVGIRLVQGRPDALVKVPLGVVHGDHYDPQGDRPPPRSAGLAPAATSPAGGPGRNGKGLGARRAATIVDPFSVPVVRRGNRCAGRAGHLRRHEQLRDRERMARGRGRPAPEGGGPATAIACPRMGGGPAGAATAHGRSRRPPDGGSPPPKPPLFSTRSTRRKRRPVGSVGSPLLLRAVRGAP